MIAFIALTIYPVSILVFNVLFVFFYYAILWVFLLIISLGFINMEIPPIPLSISLLNSIWVILNVIFFIITIIIISLKKKHGDKAIIILLLAYSLTGVSYVIADVLTSGSVIWTVDFGNIIRILILILSTVFPCIGLLYFKKSERVRVYFRGDGEKELEAADEASGMPPPTSGNQT